MKKNADYFNSLYRENPDPWNVQHRWYEQRKRALLMASLIKPHYKSIFEIGCGIGLLSQALAERTDKLLSCDMSETAIRIAKETCLYQDHIQFEHRRLPQEWPKGHFQLIVISEIGYYLSEEDLHHLIEHIQHSLTDDGEIIACHWRAPIEGIELNGNEVHDILNRYLQLSQLLHHSETDFLLELWSKNPASVSEQEGSKGEISC